MFSRFLLGLRGLGTGSASACVSEGSVCRAVSQGKAVCARSIGLVSFAEVPGPASRGPCVGLRWFSSERSPGDASHHSLEGRYAHALLQAAQEAKCLDQVSAEVEALKKLLATSMEFEAFARSPGVAAEVKIDVVQQMTTTFKLSPVTRNFLCTVAENKRMAELGKILSVFEVLCRAARGEVKVSVTSARELGNSQRRDVIAALQKRLGADAKLLVDFEVDSSIQGGLLVEVDGNTLDLTVATRIDLLRQRMEAPVVS